MRLALFQPDIPQNLGSSIRLAACLGAAVDIIEPCGFAISDKAIRRTAMDYGDSVDLTRHRSWDAFLAAPERQAGRLVLLTTKAAQPYHAFDYLAGDTLLLGRESAGVPDEVHAAAQARLVIPIRPPARSLNVVTAAAIALAEGLRQTDDFYRGPV
jgi:tRNA (cytidine/uridine-2'-O-)-methyltransferase